MVNIITDVSKGHIAFIFRVKNFKDRYGERERERNIQRERKIYFDCLTLKKMAQRSFQTSVRRDVTPQKN